MDILSSREWAILIWALLTVGYVSFSSKRHSLTKSLKAVLGTLLSRHIVSAVALMSIYVSLIIYGLSQVGLWDSSQLKNTVVWYFAVAALYLFRLDHIKSNPQFLRDAVFDQLKLIGVIEYLIGVYTFHIFFELILVPALFVLSAMLVLTETKPEHQYTHKLLKGLLVVIGFCILSATFYLMFADFGKVASRDGIFDFAIPLLLTAAYMPFVGFMVVYSTYQTVLIKLRFSIKRKPVELYARLAALLAFNFRINLLERWASNVALLNISSVRDVNQSIGQIFKMVAREKNPPKVDRSEGWSPYEAKDFLISEGIKTRHYHPVDPEDDQEWFCCSDLVEIDQGLFPNNIAFYLDGNERAVKSLKLKLNVNAPEYASEAHAKLLSVAEVLVRKALGLELNDILGKAITHGIDGLIEGGDFKIKISKHIRPKGGYDLGLELSGI